MLKTPVLFINFKTYEEGTGQKALELAKTAFEVSKQENASIVLVVQNVDLRLISQSVELPVFAQHIDPIEYGSNTGKVLPEAIKEAGATGTILNHAENKQSNEFIEKAIARAKSVGLTVMVCAESTARAIEIASMKTKPDFIAVEPPELIGGNVSVSTANPELIAGSVRTVSDIDQNIKVITGAGIKSSSDAQKAVELGSLGVFVASGIVKASNQEQAIRDLVRGML